tara:strand:- start:10250 stop:10756 length:507 start_codon:yes stop_codon:yes gene_type:complete
MTEKENFIQICDLTTSIVGLEKGSLSLKSRKQSLQIPRMVAAMVARIEEKTPQTVIADVLNRHRTLVYHYERMHKSNYVWKKYRDIFNKVYMSYKKIENSKKIFIDKYHMKEFILNSGVKQSKKNEVRILINSGDVSTILITSYMDFSNQLENLKVALKDYKYTMEII